MKCVSHNFRLVAEEMGVPRDSVPLDGGTNLAEILSNALPQSSHDKLKDKTGDSSVSRVCTLGI